jgi:hypothetical protein
VPDPERVLPEYLTVYLNTQFGIGQIKRRAMRSINQANVSAAEVRKILIPLIDLTVQQQIASIINSAFEKLKQSDSEFETARQRVEKELRLNEVSFDRATGFGVPLSEVENSLRIDAQHYEPRYKMLIKHLGNFQPQQVRSIRTVNRRGEQPIYFRTGPIDVINSQHLSATHIKYNELQKTSMDEFVAVPDAHVQKNDLLVYTTGAYVGRTNVYLRNTPAMASNHVNMLRLKADIDAAYMAVVFQSIVGQFQTKKHARGTAQAELYPFDIDKFIVPLLDTDIQKEIGDGVRRSLACKEQAHQMIEEAKVRVEQIVNSLIIPNDGELGANLVA